jgi:hypothetical protein
VTVALSLTHTLTLSHTHSHTFSHTYSLSHTHSHSLSLTHTLTHSLTHTLQRSLLILSRFYNSIVVVVVVVIVGCSLSLLSSYNRQFRLDQRVHDHGDMNVDDFTSNHNGSRLRDTPTSGKLTASSLFTASPLANRDSTATSTMYMLHNNPQTTLREDFYEDRTRLEKSNFDLKMKVYHLEGE